MKTEKYDSTIDCKSDIGITIGLIDSIMTIAAILNERMRHYLHEQPEVVEALRDLRQDADVLKLMLWNMPMESAESIKMREATDKAYNLLVEKGIVPKRSDL